jgi:hypothetical protein
LKMWNQLGDMMIFLGGFCLELAFFKFCSWFCSEFCSWLRSKFWLTKLGFD